MYDAVVHDLIAFSLQNRTEFKHYGVGQDANHPRGSGRYPKGSGKRPHQHDPVARAQYLKVKNASSGGGAGSGSRRMGEKPEQTIHNTTREKLAFAGASAAYVGELTAGAVGTLAGMPTFGLLFGAHIGGAIISDKLESQEQERREGLKVDEKTGFHLKNLNHTIEDDVALSNFPVAMAHAGNRRNDALCAMSYDMRRRGYDVMAQPLYASLKEEQYKEFYPDGKFKNVVDDIKMSSKYTMSGESMGHIARNLNSLPENSRGILRCKGSLGGTHALTYERTMRDGRQTTMVGDVRKGKTYDMKSAKQIVECFRLCKDVKAMRTDNLTPNMGRMHEVCE